MKKQLLYRLRTIAIVGIAAAFNWACSNDPDTPEPTPEATIEITDITPGTDRVSFRLTPTDAVAVAYKVEPKTGEDPAEFTRIESAEAKTVEVTGLKPDLSYTLTAIAYNADGKASAPAIEEFATEALPAEPATISLQVIRVRHGSISFSLKTENAARIAYKVDVPDGKEEMTTVENTAERTYTIGNLQAETDYILHAVAYNRDNVPSDPETYAFTTPAYEPFAQIKATATAHGLYIKTEVDSEQFPLYFLKVFDPAFTESSADFSEQFKVDSREQFIHYLEAAMLTPDLKTAPIETWNKALLSSSSRQVLLYAVPVVRDGGEVICQDFGEIIEIPLDIPVRDELGTGTAAVVPGEPQVDRQKMTVSLTAQDAPVAYMAALANKIDIEAAGSIEAYVQQQLDDKSFDYNIASTQNMPESWETETLAFGTDYYFFTFAYDADGRLGELQIKEFSTADNISYNPDVKVTVEKKEIHFTTAKFTATRHGFEKGLYSYIDKETFQKVYNGNADKYIQQEMIAPGKYPSAIYQDGDFSCSFPKLTYGTEYVLVVLPKVDKTDNQYGTPTVIDFKTLTYEVTSIAQAEISVNSITDNWGVSAAVSLTITPNDDCIGVYYLWIEGQLPEGNIGEYIAKNSKTQYLVLDGPTVQTNYIFSKSYFAVIPVDSEGRMAEAIVSEELDLPKK